jgi:hypothetical protein
MSTGGFERRDLADFLRRHRGGLTPAAVGLSTGGSRRTAGLRREEVAQLTGMSVDYYVRLEQGRSPHPSQQMLRALARTLRLTDDEHDHLFRLAGHEPPARTGASAHVRPGVLLVLDRLDDCAAFVASDTGVTLAQNRLAALLLGDMATRTGPARSALWRWFCDPAERERYPAADHEHQSRVRVAEFRMTWGRRRSDADVRHLLADLHGNSPEFARMWADHEVAARHEDHKRLVHPAIGTIELRCELLLRPEDGQQLVLLTAAPGSEDQEKLDLLRVIGDQAGERDQAEIRR